MKAKLIIALLISLSAWAQAQKVDTKGGLIYINDSAVLKYETTPMVNETSIYLLSSKDEIIHIIFTRKPYNSYATIQFLQDHVNFDSRSLIIIWNAKAFIKKLLKEGVLATDGGIDADKARALRKKYEIPDTE